MFNLTLDVTLYSQYGLDGLLMRASFSGGKTEEKKEKAVSDSFTFFAYVDVSQGKVAHTRFALFYFCIYIVFLSSMPFITP